MQISILLLKQIVQLFLMILMGYIMVKIKFLKEEDSKVISKIILYLIVPSVIITAFQVDYTPSIMKGLAVACIASVILQFLLLFVTWIMGKMFKHGGIHICLLFQLRKSDRTISYLYLRKRMGHLRLCLHECSIILHLDPLQM